MKLENGSYERSGPPIMMVERDSAFLSWREETRLTIETDHTLMVKFTQPNDRHYILVKDYIKQFIRDINQGVQVKYIESK